MAAFVGCRYARARHGVSNHGVTWHDVPHDSDNVKKLLDTRSSCMESFFALHKFKFDLNDFGSDLLLARLKRECDQWTMSFQDIEQVCTRWSLPRADPVSRYLHGLRLYLNTLAAAGTKMVTTSHCWWSDNATYVVFAPYHDIYTYHAHAVERTMAYIEANSGANDAVVLEWLRIADQTTRTKAIELVCKRCNRDAVEDAFHTHPQYTVGQALNEAQRLCASEWMLPRGAAYYELVPVRSLKRDRPVRKIELENSGSVGQR